MGIADPAARAQVVDSALELAREFIRARARREPIDEKRARAIVADLLADPAVVAALPGFADLSFAEQRNALLETAFAVLGEHRR